MVESTQALENEFVKFSVSKKTKTAKKKKNLTICLADASHVRPLLIKLIEQEKTWVESQSKDNARLRWVQPNLDDIEVLNFINSGPSKMASRYPDCKVLAHKNVFGEMMNLCIKL